MKIRKSFRNAVLIAALILTAVPISLGSGPESYQHISTRGSIRTIAFGVNMWSGTPGNLFYSRDLPLLQQLGVRYIRTGTGVTDAFVDRALQEGIDVIGTLATTGLPDLSVFGDYVYHRVAYFKGRVRAWIVFNEPNWDGFRNDPQGYTKALKTAYVRAKEADPNITICTGNFLSTEGALTFLQSMYSEGAKGYFDVLGVDPYCYPASPLEPDVGLSSHTFWKIPMLYNLMVQKGDGDKKVWIVEFGYRTPGVGYYLSDGKTVSDEDQATYLVQAMELASTWPWLERFYIYEWMDSADVVLGWWGLIRGANSPPYETKPAFDSVKEII